MSQMSSALYYSSFVLRTATRPVCRPNVTGGLPRISLQSLAKVQTALSVPVASRFEAQQTSRNRKGK